MNTIMFAYIYYNNTDRAFERAARHDLNSKKYLDIAVEFIGVKSKQDFIRAWQKIADQAQYNKVNVKEVFIFSHSLKKDDDSDNGLEFVDGTPFPNTGNPTLTQTDILALPKLPWHNDGTIHLFGCNTGLVGARGWCPASAFLQGQAVKQVNGERGYAYFSKKRETYVETGPTDTEIYLHAYNLRKNNPLGDGKLIEVAKFTR